MPRIGTEGTVRHYLESPNWISPSAPALTKSRMEYNDGPQLNVFPAALSRAVSIPGNLGPAKLQFVTWLTLAFLSVTHLERQLGSELKDSSRARCRDVSEVRVSQRRRDCAEIGVVKGIEAFCAQLQIERFVQREILE